MHLVSKTTTKKHSSSHNTYLLYNNRISKITASTTTAKGFVRIPKWVWLVTCIAYEYISKFFQPFVWLSPQEWSMRQKKSSSLERHVANNEARHTGSHRRAGKGVLGHFLRLSKYKRNVFGYSKYSTRNAMPSKNWTYRFRSAEKTYTEDS